VGDHIQATGINLKVELAEDLPSVYGNARQLGDLWVNLLLFTRDTASDGLPHTVCIRSKAESTNLVAIEIYDKGQTISAEEIEKLFDPDFYKLISGRGSGIELSICHEIVRQHHGQITIESDPVQGTTFRVLLGGAT
jgi:signal transduction histidine kinase